jgi:hypothetical protein
MKLTPITLKGNDERGYTAEYLHERSGMQLLLFRKAGSVSGRHYHKGLSATKNPEIFVVVHGTCTINWRHIDHETIDTMQVTGPVRLDIPPYIWHEVIAGTDCTFLELNSVEEHIVDTFYLD